MGNDGCLFCGIINNEISSEILYEDEKCLAFSDIDPQAPTHLLIVPRVHLSSLDTAGEADRELLGHLLLTAGEIARDKGFSHDGYRVVLNTNSDGGQTVFHLHVHLLAGRRFIFPPG